MIIAVIHLVKDHGPAGRIANIYSLLGIRQRALKCSISCLALILTLGGCASPSLRERIHTAETLARDAKLHGRVISSRGFNFQIFQRRPAVAQSELVIYIEGDGLAWSSRRRISSNPTPVNPVALRLATRDPSPALAYIARPCQYLPLAGQPDCNPHSWTDARYSRHIVQAFMEMLTRLKMEFGSRRLGLVGYSGGGTIAALLVAQRRDVAWLVTVAGNLNPDLWARLHGVSPLGASLNPVAAAHALEDIAQLHLIGGADTVMPVAIAESLRGAMDRREQIRIVTVPGQDHGCCWQQNWPRPLCANFTQKIPTCTGQQ